jgi:hypothetical protein
MCIFLSGVGQALAARLTQRRIKQPTGAKLKYSWHRLKRLLLMSIVPQVLPGLPVQERLDDRGEVAFRRIGFMLKTNLMNKRLCIRSA